MELYLPSLGPDVWTIRNGYVLLLGSIDDFGGEPENAIPFREWLLQ